jgi:hypothetical protein
MVKYVPVFPNPNAILFGPHNAGHGPVAKTDYDDHEYEYVAHELSN